MRLSARGTRRFRSATSAGNGASWRRGCVTLGEVLEDGRLRARHLTEERRLRFAGQGRQPDAITGRAEPTAGRLEALTLKLVLSRRRAVSSADLAPRSVRISIGSGAPSSRSRNSLAHRPSTSPGDAKPQSSRSERLACDSNPLASRAPGRRHSPRGPRREGGSHARSPSAPGFRRLRPPPEPDGPGACRDVPPSSDCHSCARSQYLRTLGGRPAGQRSRD